MPTERLHAKGPRGEACTIVRIADLDDKDTRSKSDVPETVTYRLAAGERRIPTEDPKEFETLEGKRRFTIA